MSETPKEMFVRYLENLHDAVLWKLDGLSEYDARRPVTPTGTNVLGVIKHLAYVEAGYFGDTFGRPFPEPLPAFDDDAEYNADLWAAPDESREYIVGLYEKAWAHAHETFAEQELNSVGRVPWWPEERAEVTLHQILVHMTVETARHAGHIDIVREMIDDFVGMRPEAPNLPEEAFDWPSYVAKVDAAARAAAEA